MPGFDAFWLSGPWRKVGKAEARMRFEASVKTDEDWADIQAARDAYALYCRENRWYTAQLGSVWFGRRKGWRDWIPDTEAMADAPEPEPNLEAARAFVRKTLKGDT